MKNTKKKVSVLGLLFLLMLSTNASIAQNVNYTELYSLFGEIPSSMTNTELKAKAKGGTAIKKNLVSLLDESLVFDDVIIPIGKYKKGKNMILLYMLVDRQKENPGKHKISLITRTIHTKSAEVVASIHHVLDINNNFKNNITTGSFEIVDNEFLEITQITNNNGVTSSQVSQYEMGKTLRFVNYIK